MVDARVPVLAVCVYVARVELGEVVLVQLEQTPDDGTVAFFGDLCMRPWSANPRWVPSFDDFPLTSVEVKASLFRQAVEERWTVVLSHEPRSPIGRLVADRDRFRFESTV